jgi:sRNA-binding carbon storage regulator CsrA
LKVVAICGKQVRLGFTAPQHVSIQRKELRQRVKTFATCAVRRTGASGRPLNGVVQPQADGRQ